VTGCRGLRCSGICGAPEGRLTGAALLSAPPSPKLGSPDGGQADAA
jgi:hypothetical protein